MSTSRLLLEGRAEASAPAARVAVSAVFIVNGFAFANWVPHPRCRRAWVWGRARSDWRVRGGG